MTVSIGFGPIFVACGLGQSADGLGWIGSHRMDPRTTLWSSASWMNARSLLHTGHLRKSCVDLIKKNWLTCLEQSQPRFTAVIHAHSATNSENFAKIICVLSEITEQEPVVKTGSSFDR